jgi:hypothetical protein
MVTTVHSKVGGNVKAMSIPKGAAGDNEGACQLRVRVGMRNAAAMAGLPTSHACGHARCGGCGGVADFACVWACAMRRVWRDC